ncbi:MAG: c-type cytochrome [Planctomycetaceae bacterium]
MAGQRLLVGLAGLALLATGCQRTAPQQWEPSEQVQSLPQELSAAVTKAVMHHAGTVFEPRFVGIAPAKAAPEKMRQQQRLKHGQAVYMKRCYQCHGVAGDGRGPVADSLYPRPRDYTPGIFKFTSTPYGVKPLRSDLMTTLRRGIAGTSMPSFRLLPDADIEAVVDYVILLSRRGELQLLLAGEAESSEELDEDVVTEYVDVVAGRWKDAGTLSTASLTPQPELTLERAQQGRQAFLESGCAKCHGEDGRGHTKDNIGQDAWGFPTRAADLTSGMLRGGQEPMDIYRRILNGINGTPMPGFRSVLEADPERAWNLVSYVLEISGRRREDTRAGRSEIPAGLIKPYLAAPSAGDSETPADADSSTDSSAE